MTLDPSYFDASGKLKPFSVRQEERRLAETDGEMKSPSRSPTANKNPSQGLKP